MLNRTLITTDGTKIYPQYMTTEGKALLRDKYGERTEYMFCGCRQDGVKLWYRISKDNRLYPEHMNYIHMPGCIFYNSDDALEKGYAIDIDTGEVTVNLKFKPNTFSYTPENKGVASKPQSEPKEKKEPDAHSQEKALKLDLPTFIRELYIDTYNERMVEKSLLSRDYFISSVTARAKKVRLNGASKTLGELTLDDDHFQFFMFPFIGFEEKAREDGDSTYYLKVPGRDEKVYTWFIYSSTMRKALERFAASYGMDPDYVGDGVMCAGFRYNAERRNSIGNYKVVGRICLFVTDRYGHFCRTLEERESLNALCDAVRKKGLKIFLGGSDDFYDVCIESQEGNKSLLCEKMVHGLTGYNIIVGNMHKATLNEEEIRKLTDL